MHKSSMERMKWFRDNYITDQKTILDIGSCDVNGAYKKLFHKYDYTGVDICKGGNVDIVLKNPYKWNEIDSKYDIIISGQTLEHTEFFWLTVAEMVKVLKKGGLLCLIAPSVIGEHRYPVDCYRYYCDGMIAIAKYYCLEILHADTNSKPIDGDNSWLSNFDTMLVAKKNYPEPLKTIDLNTYVLKPANHKKVNSDFIKYKHLVK